ncbi:tRNA (adenosine(37)-N6)-threonylcarbamoyltransferase complex dimerization subunit type 1 TsaB [Clostridium niameyense]|uniref:tRNA (Adenosine(37)-N6)-threonylcarbamoyltransferase complex dimerization subunit type 1 TsaB n=1 Tax=Clostridium niameyense TaxID=1622073 RepID=A0A6M0RB48_9CLOT|nr:tRNA (adenosine(37)-N6)-threonylcarbamoyltransferase complex dimerization subunit type 1 TsaB [Clostridium niameyense]NEZ46779.1 tRNA (adenosine(37)-N6)-threonylcarbamoyltransferase complex dimerization subunit type 1 TsaB [Clostridium niameyense]
MKILSLDSATECATCSVLDENKLYGEISFNYKKQHSVILMTMIDTLLKNINCEISSIDGFVISKGPGSFTGLRIGAATIKGLAQGTKKPFVSVSSLDSLAYNLAYTPGIICPILDALRGNVYTALYTFENENLEKIMDHDVISIEDLTNILKSKQLPVTFIGDGIHKFKDFLINALKDTTIRFAPNSLNITRSSSLGELGLNLLKQGIEDDIYTFAPLYIRKSQAEREYEKKMEKLKNE